MENTETSTTLQENIITRSFGLHLAFLKISGLHPLDSYPNLYPLYSNFVYYAFTVPITILTMTYLTKESDMEKICETGFVIFEISVLLVKVLPFKNNPKGVRKILEYTKRNIFHSYVPNQQHIIEDAIWTSRSLFKLLCYPCIVSLLMWPVKSLITEGRSYPIGIWLPYDPFGNTVVYWATFLYLYLMIVIVGVTNVSVDTIIPSLIYHAAAQIKIIKDTMTHLVQIVDKQIPQDSKSMFDPEKTILRNRIIYEKICHCVKHYDVVYDFVTDLEDMYSLSVFSQFLASILVICLTCFRLSVIDPFTVPFFATFIYTMAAFIEIFLFSYTGTILYEESNTLINAVYMSEWYNFDQKSKRALLILMERAKRPMKITAGKLYVLSLGTFTMIIRRSYSLLAVLRNFEYK